jgi:hypothetical protein
VQTIPSSGASRFFHTYGSADSANCRV